MAVVAAGVHAPGVAGMVGEVVLLVDRQRVHVGAQADRPLAGAGAQHPDHAGLADAAMGFDTEGFEALGHQRGGAVLLEGEFRVGVDVTADGGDLRVIGPERIQKVHDASRETAHRP